MSHNRDWFTTYELVYNGLVLMGNDAQCKVDGLVYQGIVYYSNIDH